MSDRASRVESLFAFNKNRHLILWYCVWSPTGCHLPPHWAGIGSLWRFPGTFYLPQTILHLAQQSSKHILINFPLADPPNVAQPSLCAMTKSEGTSLANGNIVHDTAFGDSELARTMETKGGGKMAK